MFRSRAEFVSMCNTIYNIKAWLELWTRMLVDVFQYAVDNNSSNDENTIVTKLALRVVYTANVLPFDDDMVKGNVILGAVKWMHLARSHPTTFAFMSKLLSVTIAYPDAFTAARDIIFYETIERPSGNEHQRLLMFSHMYMQFYKSDIDSRGALSEITTKIVNRIRDLLICHLTASKTTLDLETRTMMVRASWDILAKDEAAVRSGHLKPADVIWRFQDCVVIIVACAGGFVELKDNVVAARTQLVRRLCSIARSFYKADSADTKTLNRAVGVILRIKMDRIDSLLTLMCGMEVFSKENLSDLMLFIVAFSNCGNSNNNNISDAPVLFCSNVKCRNLSGPSELELKTYASDSEIFNGCRFCSQACSNEAAREHFNA